MSDPQLDFAAAQMPLEQRFAPLVARPPAEVEALRCLWLPANEPPWTDTGLVLREEQWFSLLAAGRVAWSRHRAELWAGPRHHLWGRIGAGKVFNPTQDTTTRRAETSGRLELGILHGMWASERGELATPSRLYEHLSGGIDVLVVVWKGEPEAGLRALAQASPGDALVLAECERWARPVPVPNGWSYLYETGTSDVYTECETPYGPGIRVSAANDQGIIRKPIAFPLAPDTVLRWRWCLMAMPSDLPEDVAIQHDYVSIAVEFEDGRDLTWFWSSTLEPGSHFACPIEAWNEREFHLCVRSGAAGLGAWQSETRNVYEDCLAALGATPQRIVRAWLITVSTFQHGRARAEFADIALERGSQRLQVL